MLTRPSRLTGAIRLWHRVALSGVLLLAAGLRFHRLGGPSLWLDEIAQAVAAARPLPEILAAVQAHHGAAPLDYLITALVVRITPAEWALRLPAALWGVLSVYWMARLGRRLGSPTAGVIAALLLAVHPLHLRYSQEARFYSLFILLTLISTEALWRAWDRPTWRSWGIYALLLALGLYTHYFTALVLGLHGIWCLSRWIIERRRHPAPTRTLWDRPIRFLIAAAGAIIAFAPWLLYAVVRERGSPWMTPPTLDMALVAEVLERFAGGALTWIWLILAIGGLIRLLRRDQAGAILLLSWAVLPLPLIVLIDRWGRYAFFIRQALFILPALLLLVAQGLVAFGEMRPRAGPTWARRLANGLYGLLLLTFIVALGTTLQPRLRSYYTKEQREDWRSVGAMLSANLRPDARVLPFNVQNIIGFYSPRAARQALPARSLADVRRAYATARPLWILDTPYLSQWAEAQAIRTWLADQPKATFDFGMGMRLHYLRAGVDERTLLETAGEFAIPEQPHAWASKARIRRALGDLAAALAAYEHAARLARDPELIRDYRIAAGDTALSLGDLPRAQRLYDQALAIDPRSSEAYLKKGFAYLKAGQPARALALFDTARVELGREDYWLYRWTGEALAALGRPAEALPYYQRALALNPQAHDLRYHIGSLYAQLGDPSAARTWWQSYLDRDPDGPLASAARANLRRLASSGERD